MNVCCRLEKFRILKKIFHLHEKFRYWSTTNACKSFIWSISSSLFILRSKKKHFLAFQNLINSRYIEKERNLRQWRRWGGGRHGDEGRLGNCFWLKFSARLSIFTMSEINSREGFLVSKRKIVCFSFMSHSLTHSSFWVKLS